jgi:uncharacterized protein YcbK (DUF882 family)
MLPSFPWRPLVALPAGALLIGLGARVVFGTEVRTRLGGESKAVRAELVNVPTASSGSARMRIDFDSLIGRSGSLRSRLLEPSETRFYPGVAQRFGHAVRTPGVRRVDTGIRGNAGSFAFITLAPWRQKVGTHINGYHVGYWPGEFRVTTDRYENPEGFIEVTPDNVDTPLSTHFRLRDFITRDQQHVWPKYVVLREELLDKLELMLNAMQSFGVPTHHVVVLSGFRSPQYNARGASEGMARSSRHQFGDAADLIIDADRDGRMDDLNQDGRVTFADLQVVDRAIQLIERQYPELVGGLGLYHEMGPSGPFAHVDVRGTRARWTNLRTQRRSTGVVAQPATAGPVQPSARCSAEGAMAVLCAGVR